MLIALGINTVHLHERSKREVQRGRSLRWESEGVPQKLTPHTYFGSHSCSQGQLSPWASYAGNPLSTRSRYGLLIGSLYG